MIQRSFAGLKFVSPAFSTPCLSSGAVNRSDAWHITVALPAQQRCAQTISANVLKYSTQISVHFSMDRRPVVLSWDLQALSSEFPTIIWVSLTDNGVHYFWLVLPKVCFWVTMETSHLATSQFAINRYSFSSRECGTTSHKLWGRIGWWRVILMATWPYI